MKLQKMLRLSLTKAKQHVYSFARALKGANENS